MKLIADGANLTSYCSSISVTADLAGHTATLAFSLPKGLGTYGAPYMPICGSIVSLFLAEEVFRGIVVTVDDGKRDAVRYTVCDYGFYLNKNKEVYQFSGIPADDAIGRVCADFGIPVYRMCGIPHPVEKIYADSPISDVIGDILEQAGNAGGHVYGFDVVPKGLRVFRVGEEAFVPTFRLASNIAPTDSVKHRGNVTHKVSIEEMRNAVKIVSGEEQGYVRLAEARDEANIAKFGRLQEVVSVDEDDGDPLTLAKTLLAARNTAKETFSFTVLLDEDAFPRPGYLLNVDGQAYILDGVRQEWKNGRHTATFSLERSSS